MSRYVWVLLLAIGLAGCDPEAIGNESGLCTTVCRCTAGPLPNQVEACVTNCIADEDVGMSSNACVECVFVNGASCSDLFATCIGSGGPCSSPPQGDDAAIPDASIMDAPTVDAI